MSAAEGTRKVIASDDPWEPLDQFLRYTLGQSVYLGESPIHEEGDSIVYPLCASIPQSVMDREEGLLSIHHLKFDNIGSVRLNSLDEGYEALVPPRAEVKEEIQSKRRDLRDRVARAVLETTKQRIVQTSLAENCLNPLREILLTIGWEGSVRPAELGKKAEYIPLLKDLGYIAKDNDSYREGPAFLAFEQSFQEPLSRMLGDIVEESYRTLVTDYNLKQLVPLVRTAHAYFWASYQAGRRLLLEVGDIGHYHKLLYQKSKKKPELINHLAHLEEVDVITRENGGYRADSGLWDHFEARAPALTA